MVSPESAIMTKYAAIVGHPVTHSQSPQMHNAAYADLKLDWQYLRQDVPPGGLANFISSHRNNFQGLSVTMPLKVEAVAVADVVTPLAKLLNSANTLLITDTAITAGNTDVIGIRDAIRSNIKKDFLSCTIIGTGATARSALAAALSLKIKEISVVGRSVENLELFGNLSNSLGVKVTTRLFNELVVTMDSDLVINTVPKGVMDEYAMLIPSRPRVLLEVNYAPWPSPLAREWLLRNGRVVSGLEMLLYQGVKQFEIFTNRKAPIKVMRAALGQ
jgi:shikimate dehydrogenase